MRAAIYARVSTEHQERDGTSLESQVERCLAHAGALGWTVEDRRVLQEQGSGGAIERRPKLDQLLRWAHAGVIDAVVCYALDRLSRNLDDQGWLRRELRLAGVRVEFVTGHKGRIYQAVDGALAEGELDKIRERVARGKVQTAKRGKYLPARRPPFGYQFRREVVERVVKSRIERVERVVALDENPLTAPILREMFEYIAKGGTATGCAKWLNDRGILPQWGQRWRHAAVCVIVRNPVYKGQAQALRYQISHDPDTRETKLALRAEEDRVTLPTDIAPSLVSRDLWQRANDQLDANQTGARRNHREPELYLLRAGFVRCGECGGAVSAYRVEGEPTYRCTQRVQKGCPGGGRIYARILDEAVWSLAKAVLKDPAWIRQQLADQADDALPDRIAAAGAVLAKLEREENQLAESLGQLADPTPVVKRLNQVSAARRLKAEELDDLQVQRRHAERIRERMGGLDRRFLDTYERVDRMAYEERRAVLRQFGVQVTLWKRGHAPRFEIDWAFDLSDDWLFPTDEDESWVIWTKESSQPAVDVAATMERRTGCGGRASQASAPGSRTRSWPGADRSSTSASTCSTWRSG